MTEFVYLYRLFKLHNLPLLLAILLLLGGVLMPPFNIDRPVYDVQQSNHSAKQSGEELSRLHDDHLIRLAQLANLTYAKLDSTHALSDAVRDAGFSTIKSVPIDLRWLPASLALLALGWRFLPLI